MTQPPQPHNSEELRKKIVARILAASNSVALSGGDHDLAYAAIDEEADNIMALLASARQEAETAIIEKLKPLLVDESHKDCPYPYEYCDHTPKNKLRAELREALGISEGEQTE